MKEKWTKPVLLDLEGLAKGSPAGYFESMLHATTLVTFDIIESRIERTIRLSPSQGLLPSLAETAGTTFGVAIRIIRARKPEVSGESLEVVR